MNMCFLMLCWHLKKWTHDFHEPTNQPSLTVARTDATWKKPRRDDIHHAASLLLQPTTRMARCLAAAVSSSLDDGISHQRPTSSRWARTCILGTTCMFSNDLKPFHIKHQSSYLDIFRYIFKKEDCIAVSTFKDCAWLYCLALHLFLQPSRVLGPFHVPHLHSLEKMTIKHPTTQNLSTFDGKLKLYIYHLPRLSVCIYIYVYMYVYIYILYVHLS